MRLWKVAVHCVAMTLLAGGTLAHHSQSTFYKLEESVELTGVVKSFALRNPHPEIVMDVTEADGSTVEMHVYAEAAAGMMMQGGWTRDTVAPGDTITVVGNLARSSDDSMMGAAVTTANGDVLTMLIRELVDFGVPAPQ